MQECERVHAAFLRDLRECSHGKGCVGIPHDKGIELSPSTAGIMMRAGLMVLVVAVVVVTISSKQKNKIGQLSVDDGGSSGYNNSIGYKLELQVLRTGIFANRRLGCNTQPRPALPARAAEQERDASTCLLHRM